MSTDHSMIAKVIYDAINARVEEIAKEEIEAAKKRLEQRTKEVVTTVSTKVFSHFSITRPFGEDLKIEVTFKR